MTGISTATKNDCEKNAIKRYLAHVKREHPHLNLVILLDGLYADNPTIELIRSYGWHYIIVAKDGNHKWLIEAMNVLCDQGNLNRDASGQFWPAQWPLDFDKWSAIATARTLPF